MRHAPRVTLLNIAAAVAAASCHDGTATDLSPAAAQLSFAVIGCNRVDAADTLGDTSTANVAQLRQTFADIAALPERPKILFFAGDLVFGYTNDTLQLARQLTAWRTLYEASPLPALGVELVAVPGNHETQNLAKVATAAAERTWLRVMAPYVTRGGNGPAAGGADALATDQSRLTYSFDVGTTHFVTLNTDPVGNDWHVPNAWVAADLAAARARGAAHAFVIGHKPAYAYPTVATDGLSRDPAARDRLWSAFTAERVDAMYSAHNHVFWRAQPAGATWQVIAGNGGSKLETAIDPTIPATGAYFGFVLTTIRNDGRVVVRSYGRDVPTAGYTAAVAASASVRDSFEIVRP
jgi:hypothetical protein